MQKALPVYRSQSLSEWTVYLYMALPNLSSAPAPCLIGARTSVPLAHTEFAVLRPASVSMEGNVIT